MVDIATLDMVIKSSTVKDAADNLDRLDREGAKADRTIGKFSQTCDKLARYLRLMADAFAAYKIASFVKDVTMLSARYETLGVAMNVVGNNAGYTGRQMAEFQTQLEKNGIAMMEARETLTKMASAHIDLTNAQKLSRIAQDAAVIGGINSSEAFSRMIDGIQRGEVEILKTIGINVNFESSYKRLAAEIGKKSDQLTELEKVQARVNAVMAKGQDIAGAYEAAMGTAGKQITSMKRYIDNLKISLGEVFQDALIVMVDQFTGALKGANKEMDDLRTKGQLKEWGRQAVLSLAIVADYLIFLKNLISTVTAGYIGAGMSAYNLLKAGGQVAHGNIKGAWESVKGIKDYAASFGEQMGETWGGGLFKVYGTAQKLYADRDRNAPAEQAAAAAAEQKRIQAAKDRAEAALSGGGSSSSKTAKKVKDDHFSMWGEIQNWSKKVAESIRKDREEADASAQWITDQRNAYAKATADMIKRDDAATESALRRKIAQTEAAQAYMQIGKTDGVTQQKKDYEDLLGYQEQMLKRIDRLKKPDAWIAQQQEIDNTRAKILELSLALRDLTGTTMGGLMEGLARYVYDLPSTFEQVRDLTVNAFRGMEDALVRFVEDGKLSFKSLVDSILADIARIAIRQAITGPLAQGLSGLFSGGGWTADTVFNPDWMSGARADGGQVVAGRNYLVGERAPEIFTPGTSGTITPIKSGGSNVTLNITNNSGQPVDAKKTGMKFDGRRYVLDIVMEAAQTNMGFRKSMTNMMGA